MKPIIKPPTTGTRPARMKPRHALEQLLPEVPAARKAGEAVVEADREAERRDRVVRARSRSCRPRSETPSTRPRAPPCRASRRSASGSAGESSRTASGIARHFAIDSVVLAVGRIVVWVDADADVRTAMIRSLYQGEPKTPCPSGLSTSSELLGPRNFVPANAWPTWRRRDRSARGGSSRAPPPCPGLPPSRVDSSLTATPESQPQ